REEVEKLQTQKTTVCPHTRPRGSARIRKHLRAELKCRGCAAGVSEAGGGHASPIARPTIAQGVGNSRDRLRSLHRSHAQ
ncbi:hypothetical protein PFISCL1PPCAC_12817, partial [Pristionchus fissidentatus]